MQIRFAALLLIFLFAGLFALTIDTPSEAATTLPTRMNFQGRLTNASGAIVANGTYNMRFKIYNQQAPGGTSQWSEDRLISAGNGVTVTNGQFSVQLGSVTALDAAVFASNSRFFEVELPTPASATTSSPVWTELPMAPRNQLATSAYAYNSETLDGIDGSSFAQLGTAGTFTAAQNVNVAGTNAFQVRNGATNLFNVDSTNSIITLGATDATGQVLVLDVRNTTGDPSGGSATPGAMYYNSFSSKFRCYQGVAWTDCIGAGGGGGTLQAAYDASGTPATITTTAAKGVSVIAGAAPTANLFSVSNVGQPTNVTNVNGIDVDYVAGSVASGDNSGIRIDYTPGTGTSSTTNGLKIVSANSAANTTNYGISIEGPATGGASDIGLRVASGFDIGVDIESGGLQMTGVSNTGEPGIITAGDLKLYARTNAGRTMLKMKGGSGIDTTLQPFLGANRVTLFQPTFGSNSITANTALGTLIGVTHFTAGTTASSTLTTTETAPVATNLFTSMKRTEIGTSTAASTVGDLRFAVPQFFRGGSAGLGGFYAVGRWGISQYQSGARSFAGMAANGSALANAEVTTNLNILGFGCNTADTTMSFYHNDGTGTATPISLGANYPCNTSDVDAYEYRIFVAPNGGTIYYSLARLNTTDFIEGSVTTDIPAPTTMLTPHFYIGNNATALRAELDIMSMYVETDN